ncbi:Por secretion system C-terminal sorting domain-containing protein [Pontibacter indicus]|uniref:Por secretion system C-terminal sorting domain-containing protein n=2 Tax=Pontibacter indicus TaxID=1317125 RepID=A0A1R3WDX9_9BACT|nr:Por secretion system C-terminal sorting domain-containing protein [Pontibacter indicus]
MVFIYAITIASHSNAQFTTISNLAPLAARDFATKEKHQSKVFQMDGKYWAILANSTGTHLWSLNNNSWSFERQLVTKNSRADYVIIDNTVHILLYSGSSSQFVSIEYDRDKQQFKQWNRNKSTVDINLEKDVEVASIDVDKNGRLWIASNGDNGNVNVRWSEAPYTKWSAPITLERGVHADDICAVISLPMFNQIGVLWSNQKTKRWGFKTHTTGDETTRWSKDEVPASNSALSQGTGIADDHINIKVASDGTLYAAIKTGYDKIGYPLIALLVRRPSGVWDELYEVSQTGTLPIVLLNEEQNLLKVVYTSATYGGDILYKESSTKNISFCETHTLIKGNNTYASSIKGSYSSETVILASNENQVVGVLVSDDPTLRVPLTSDCLVEEKGVNFTAIPNPFMSETTVHFSLPESEPYTLTLYDVNGARISRIHNSAAVSGKINKYTIDASSLARGLYILKLETINKVRTLKLVHER